MTPLTTCKFTPTPTPNKRVTLANTDLLKQWFSVSGCDPLEGVTDQIFIINNSSKIIK